jgi:hypothetical protein
VQEVEARGCRFSGLVIIKAEKGRKRRKNAWLFCTQTRKPDDREKKLNKSYNLSKEFVKII